MKFNTYRCPECGKEVLVPVEYDPNVFCCHDDRFVKMLIVKVMVMIRNELMEFLLGHEQDIIKLHGDFGELAGTFADVVGRAPLEVKDGPKTD